MEGSPRPNPTLQQNDSEGAGSSVVDANNDTDDGMRTGCRRGKATRSELAEDDAGDTHSNDDKAKHVEQQTR